MRERLRYDATPRHALEMIIAHGSSGTDTLFDIAFLKDLPLSLRVVRPDAGKAVCLELLADR